MTKQLSEEQPGKLIFPDASKLKNYLIMTLDKHTRNTRLSTIISESQQNAIEVVDRLNKQFGQEDLDEIFIGEMPKMIKYERKLTKTGVQE